MVVDRNSGFPEIEGPFLGPTTLRMIILGLLADQPCLYSWIFSVSTFPFGATLLGKYPYDPIPNKDPLRFIP